MQMYMFDKQLSPFLTVTRRGESVHQAVGEASVQDIQLSHHPSLACLIAL